MNAEVKKESTSDALNEMLEPFQLQAYEKAPDLEMEFELGTSVLTTIIPVRLKVTFEIGYDISINSKSVSSQELLDDDAFSSVEKMEEVIEAHINDLKNNKSETFEVLSDQLKNSNPYVAYNRDRIELTEYHYSAYEKRALIDGETRVRTQSIQFYARQIIKKFTTDETPEFLWINQYLSDTNKRISLYNAVNWKNNSSGVVDQNGTEISFEVTGELVAKHCDAVLRSDHGFTRGLIKSLNNIPYDFDQIFDQHIINQVKKVETSKNVRPKDIHSVLSSDFFNKSMSESKDKSSGRPGEIGEEARSACKRIGASMDSVIKKLYKTPPKASDFAKHTGIQLVFWVIILMFAPSEIWASYSVEGFASTIGELYGYFSDKSKIAHVFLVLFLTLLASSVFANFTTYNARLGRLPIHMALLSLPMIVLIMPLLQLDGVPFSPELREGVQGRYPWAALLGCSLLFGFIFSRFFQLKEICEIENDWKLRKQYLSQYKQQ